MRDRRKALRGRCLGLIVPEVVSRHRRAGGPLVAALVLAVGLASPQGASAYDNAPCGPQWHHARYGDVQSCPLWRGNVPVHRNADPGSPVVGYLYQGGWSNWFFCEAAGRPYYYGSLVNAWWGLTVADNGPTGWVSEVYFAGGGNWEPDRGLVNCADIRPTPTVPQ